MGGIGIRDSAGLWTTDFQRQVPTQVPTPTCNSETGRGGNWGDGERDRGRGAWENF